MSTSEIVGEEIGKQAALASSALREISRVGSSPGARHLLPRAVLDMLGPYSAALYIAERVVHSSVINTELVQALHSELLPLERMADGMLAAARQAGYFDDPGTAEPFRWLEMCNEQVKDCMVALEAGLEPDLDRLMAASIEEHQRGDTVSLDSIRWVSRYCVSLSRAAARYFERCDAPTRDRLRQKLEKLKTDPFDPQSSKPLKGRNDQRAARVGDLRILFRVEGMDIIIAEIGPRGEIYKHGQ
jgi:mRNA-degrading endonuclease RelE of RelBE toxin-antitoxin system